jgi:hypothetical protein
MAASTPFPLAQTNFQNTFSVQSDGAIQGTFVDDPAVRYALSGGILATSETVPMWGGVAIAEAIPDPANQNDALGGAITRAAATAGITGFSVFNQANAMVITPQSSVPLAGSGMQVNFFRLGSGARIWVQCDPALVSDEGNPITTQFTWDFVNQKLIAFNTTALPVKVLNFNFGNSKIVAYSSPNATWTATGSCALIQI